MVIGGKGIPIKRHDKLLLNSYLCFIFSDNNIQCSQFTKIRLKRIVKSSCISILPASRWNIITDPFAKAMYTWSQWYFIWMIVAGAVALPISSHFSGQEPSKTRILERKERAKLIINIFSH